MESSPEVRRTNPDKLMWPADGITKQDLISYYEAVSKVLVEELRGKPLTVIRAPDGIEGFRFFQKQAPDSTPDWIETVLLPAPASRRKEVRFFLCNRPETLVWLESQAALELHVKSWGSTRSTSSQIRTVSELLSSPAIETWRKERRRTQKLPEIPAG